MPKELQFAVTPSINGNFLSTHTAGAFEIFIHNHFKFADRHFLSGVPTMARSRKKSLGQQVVGAAVIAMPAPVQKVAGSRWGARLILLVAPLLFVTGIATVDWSEGRPKIRFNRERAQEVRQKLVREVEAEAGINIGHEARPSWNLPNEQHVMPAPMQPFAGNGPSQSPAAAFPRLESAANSAVGLLEAPPRYFLPENNGMQQVPGTVQPGARY